MVFVTNPWNSISERCNPLRLSTLPQNTCQSQRKLSVEVVRPSSPTLSSVSVLNCLSPMIYELTKAAGSRLIAIRKCIVRLAFGCFMVEPEYCWSAVKEKHLGDRQFSAGFALCNITFYTNGHLQRKTLSSLRCYIYFFLDRSSVHT